MKTQVTIRNGSGWNNYEALRNLKNLPVGTRGLMQRNGVSEITIGPLDAEKPFGIAVCYFNVEGEEIFCQEFDQNDSVEWIRNRVVHLLTEGIANRIAANTERINAEKLEAAKRVKAEELAAAKAAGFETVSAHKSAVAAAKGAEKARRKAYRNDPARAVRAESDMRALLPIMAAHPAPEGYTWRLTRSGWLRCDDANGRKLTHHPKTGTIDRDDLYVWLTQHGYAATLDNRMALFNAVCGLSHESTLHN
jgi:hypothetical protein